MTAFAPDGPQRAATRTDPSIIIYLALFMLLLAFFILFNSVATREASKTEALIGSLGATFGRSSPQPKKADPLALARDAFRAELGALLARVAPEAAQAPDQRDGALAVTLPTARLFRENLVAFHSRSADILSGMAALLAQVRPQHRVAVEVTLAGDPQGAAAQGLALRRAGALARELERLGAPRGAVGVGLRPSAAERTEFRFRLEPREAPAS